MLVNICTKFHEGTLNGFWVTERTWPYRKLYYFQFQRARTPKICNPVMVLALCTSSHVALHLCKVSWKYLKQFMVLVLCTSSHVDLHLCKVSWKYLKRFWSYRADTILWDGQTTWAKTRMSPNPTGGDIITQYLESEGQTSHFDARLVHAQWLGTKKMSRFWKHYQPYFFGVYRYSKFFGTSENFSSIFRVFFNDFYAFL